MATTTPNYGWDVPTSTDYVKDGATAIETLGDDIDATLYTALGGAYPGLRLVKKQTVGTAVASVTVTSAFSATYENYRIIYNGGLTSIATGNAFRFQLNNSTGSPYIYAGQFVSQSAGSVTPTGSAGASTFSCALTGSGAMNTSLEVGLPFTTSQTAISSKNYSWGGGQSYHLDIAGVEFSSTSHTGFTFSPGSGTMTGGTIYVYGYGAS